MVGIILSTHSPYWSDLGHYLQSMIQSSGTDRNREKIWKVEYLGLGNNSPVGAAFWKDIPGKLKRENTSATGARDQSTIVLRN